MIADTDTTKVQALSPEVWEAQQQEIERLSRRVAELEDALKFTLKDLEIRGLADSVSHGIYQKAEIALGYPVGIVGKPMFPEARLATLETPQKPHSLPQEVPVVLSGGDSATAPYTAPRLLIAWCFKKSPGDVRRELHIGTTYAELKQYAGVLNETHPHLEHWVEFEGEPA